MNVSWLEQARERAGLDVQSLAAAAGVSATTVYRAERKGECNSVTAGKLQGVLGGYAIGPTMPGARPGEEPNGARRTKATHGRKHEWLRRGLTFTLELEGLSLTVEQARDQGGLLRWRYLIANGAGIVFEASGPDYDSFITAQRDAESAAEERQS